MGLTILRLIILRFASGWVLILLSLNFNRVAIVELNALAVVVTSLLALQFFLAPLQAVFGRLSDAHTLLGYRRGPPMVLAALLNSLLFPLLPGLAIQLGERSSGSGLLGLLLLGGIAVASALYNANSTALLGDLLTEQQRDRFVPLIIMSGGLFGIVTALVVGAIMPIYSPEGMQQLYNCTPLVLFGCLLLGLPGLEQRGTTQVNHPRSLVHLPGMWQVVQNNPQARLFASFLFVLSLGIYIHDPILEPFGGELFAMTPEETAQLQAPLGGGLLLSSLAVGLVSLLRPLSKKGLIMVGAGLAIIALGLLVTSALVRNAALLPPTLLLFGLGVGLLQMGWFALQVQLVLPGQVGLYLGLWAGAQMLGNGVANVLAGGLHTLLIEGLKLAPASAYAAIFGSELLLIAIALFMLQRLKPEQFQTTDRDEFRLSTALADG
jgi:MFS transporter, BCD family, chlorophyll transporter